MPDWPDQLSAVSAAIAAVIAAVSGVFVVYGLEQTASALRSQRMSSDIQSVLVIWERLDQHWSRFLRAQQEGRNLNFEFGQLISYYEMACAMFRDEVLTTKAARTLEEHLDEILPNMRENPMFNELFISLRSRAETYENIRWFCDDRQRQRTLNIHRI